MLRRILIATFVFAASSVFAAIPIEVTPKQLVASPKRFQGKRIAVVGYYTSGGHSTRICQDAKTEAAGWGRDMIFINFEKFPIAEQRSNRALKHFVRVVGTFEYRPMNRRVIPQPRTKSTPRPGEVEREIVEVTLGFGWMGIYEKQIKNLAEFTVLPKR